MLSFHLGRPEISGTTAKQHFSSLGRCGPQIHRAETEETGRPNAKRLYRIMQLSEDG